MGKQAQIDYYEGLLAQHGENYLALDWNSTESQRQRYKILKEIFLYGKKSVNLSVLDVGCGFADLYSYFKADGILAKHRISYTGYDIAPRIVEVARKKHPEAKIELKDIQVEKHLPKFDYVFCSGIFNIRTLEVEDHLDLVKDMLARMYDLSSCGVAINFLSEGSLPISDPDGLNSDRYFFFEPEKIMTFARSICSRFILRHDYHPSDFAVYLLK